MCVRIAVLGGTSVGMPAFVRALSRSVQEGGLPFLELRLFGRALVRAEGMIDYLKGRFVGVGRGSGDAIRLVATSDLEAAMDGADIIVSQVRAGGMAGRDSDERLALSHGIPGDEGLGPSGLSAFLRGRSLTDELARAWSSIAPDAAFLQLTNPLGLTLERTARMSGLQPIGLCELPMTTSQSLRDAVRAELGEITHAHYGLNHQAWLYDFRDATGRPCTDAVIEIADRSGLLPVDLDRIRSERAIPVNYLRLLYEPHDELARQQSRLRTRGMELSDWNRALHKAYVRGDPASHPVIDDLLATRRMDWYDLMVVPTIAAIINGEPHEIVLNVSDRNIGVCTEGCCRLVGKTAMPLASPPLLNAPRSLFEKLIAYEYSALALGDAPSRTDLAETLNLHPLVDKEETAHAIASDLFLLLSATQHGERP